MNNKLIHRINRGLKPKKSIKKSSADDKSIIWKIPLITIFFMILLLFPMDLEIVLQIILFVVGIFMTLISIRKIQQFKLSNTWKTAEGELLYKKVAKDNPYAADRATSYFPYMKYSYQVGRKTYISDTVANYRELRDFPEEIDELMERMSSSALKVYYNPKDPS